MNNVTLKTQIQDDERRRNISLKCVFFHSSVQQTILKCSRDNGPLTTEVGTLKNT